MTPNTKRVKMSSPDAAAPSKTQDIEAAVTQQDPSTRNTEQPPSSESANAADASDSDSSFAVVEEPKLEAVRFAQP